MPYQCENFKTLNDASKTAYISGIEIAHMKRTLINWTNISVVKPWLKYHGN